MNKLAIYLKIGGVCVALASIVRWFFIYYDVSQAVLGLAIGIIIFGFGDIYNLFKINEKKIKDIETKMDENYKKLDQRIDSITKWFIKEELK